MSERDSPFISVVLTTHERPHLLPLALSCYRHQTYPRRELVVVDDGAIFPVDAADVAAVGGQLIRVEPGTPLGIKLNRGLSEARGTLCLKMDDDDWYAPQFLESMVNALMADRVLVCRRALACLAPFLFFDLARWELRRSDDYQISGATLLFSRDDWRQRPFRPIPRSVDGWFIRDQTEEGARTLRVQALESFLQVRHRGHLWAETGDGQLLDEYVVTRPLHDRTPEELLPNWALDRYRKLQRVLSAVAS